MNRTKLFRPVAGALLATGLSLAATAGLAGASGAASTTHAVTQSSKLNYSGAVEKPIWSFSCDSATHDWTFTINNVQIIDSTGHTWGGTQGPWSVGVWAAAGAGPVPFSANAKLFQNKTNGLYLAVAKGTSKNAASWCATGTSVTVVGWSGSAQPLLVDGTLS
jgi:hypothetical protein